MDLDFYNIIGYLGTFSYILSYALLQMKKIDPGMIYTLLNLAGASMVAISLIKYTNMPSLIIQFTWIMISLYSLFNILKEKRG